MTHTIRHGSVLWLVGVWLLATGLCNLPLPVSTTPKVVTLAAPTLAPTPAASAGVTAGPTAGTTAGAPQDWWQPAVGTTWQWQLSGKVDPSFEVDVYDIDLFESDAQGVAALRAQGRQVICYLSTGSWEDWRPDAQQFPKSVMGNDYADWPGEKWLDIRRIDVLAPILRARLDACQAKDFQGVEPDNVDGYTNETGFPLTAEDQLVFNRWLAQEAHQRGLSIGLKNDPDQAAELVDDFDWALTEDCFAEGWCEQLQVFIRAGKPVLAAEYTDTGMTLAGFCPQAHALQFSAILKRRELDAWRQACP
jgi:hypothetical protein